MKKCLTFILLFIFIISVFAYDIKLKIAEFDPLINVPDFSKQGLSRNAIKSDYDYFIVQFNGKIMPYHKDILRKLNCEIFDYIPENAFIVKMNSQQFNKIKGNKNIRFIQIWQPAYRISPELIQKEQKSLKGEKQGYIRLLVSAFNNENEKEFLNNILNINENITLISHDKRFILIEIPQELSKDISIALANLKQTYWVERRYPAVLHNAWSRWIMDTFDTLNMDNGSGAWYGQFTLNTASDSARMQLYAHGLYGQGQIIGDDDTGLDWDHVGFRDPTESVVYDKDGDDTCEVVNLNHRKVIAYNVIADTFDLNSSGHGTHTCGSAVADSLGSDLLNSGILPAVNGMAPLAKLAFTDIGNSSDGLDLPTDFGLIYRWAYSAGARITTSSWGYGSGGPSSYTQDAQNIDWVAWNNKDICMFRSAGNSNTASLWSSADSVNSPATAKNIVTVGATESGFGDGTTWNTVGVTTRNELLDIAEFSSHGPTAEGQMKPELCGVGGWYIWSADSDGDLSTNNSGLESMGGTSMSTPTTAGFGAIVRQYFEEGWYPSGTKVASDAFSPSGALVKALLINSTRNSPGAYSIDDINNSGTQNAPSMGQGWGRVTMADAIYFDGDIRDLWVIDETTGFSATGQIHTYTINTGPSTSEYIKVVLVWTDYPAGVSPSTVVVNDLNLEVDAGGNTYLGNVFGTNARSITGGTADDLNVTEVVWLDAIPNSSITIRVIANNIPNGPQPYALVVTGDLITITGSKPTIPEIFKLFNYARVPDLRPTLSFMSTDADGDNIIYRVLYDTDPNFASPDSFTTSSFNSGDTATVQFPVDLTDNTTYWWKVKASDPTGSGYWSAYSNERNFTISTSIGSGNCSWYQTTNTQLNANTYVNAFVEGDSIVLSAVGQVGTDTLLWEDFEDQASDFTVTNGDGDTYTWYIAATGQADLGGFEPPNAGNYYVYYSDDDAGSGNLTAEEYLWSPTIYIGAADSLNLKYDWGFRLYETGEQMTAYYRTFSGGAWNTWTLINTYNTDSSGTETIDLTTQLPCDSLELYWLYDDGGNWGWAAAIDNVLVTKMVLTSDSSGTVTTTPAYYQDLVNTYTRSDWGNINWQESSDGDSILFQVEYCQNGTWALIPDTDLPNNSTGFSSSTQYGNIDISALNTNTYDSIRVLAILTRKPVKSTTSPSLFAIEIGSGATAITFANIANLSGYYENNSILLKWNTTIEINNNKWIIERKSNKEDYKQISVLNPSKNGRYSYIDKNIKAMTEYYYRIKAISNDGNEQIFGPIRVITGNIPTIFKLNPLNPSLFKDNTIINYQIPFESNVYIGVYDITGREMVALVNDKLKTGYYTLKWNGKNKNNKQLPAGTYFIRMITKDYTFTQKAILIK